jgi:ABC-type transporter lipoprotein component MlaA
MDLYRIAYAHAPIVGSGVVREAFALAKDIRLVDMQVAPYDLEALGVQSIKVETIEGRAEFEKKQTEFAQRAQAIRATLITELDRAYSQQR